MKHCTQLIPLTAFVTAFGVFLGLEASSLVQAQTTKPPQEKPASQPAAADPFAGPAVPAKPKAADPFLKSDKRELNAALDEKPAEAVSTNIVLRWEAISMPRALARSLIGKSKLAATYEETLKLLDTNPEVHLELLAWQKTKSGQRSKLESITEFPYGTDFDPPQIPQTFGKAPPNVNVSSPSAPTTPPPEPPKPTVPDPSVKPPGNQGETGTSGAQPVKERLWPYTPSTTTAFETMNLGATFEVDPVLSENAEILILTAAPELTSFLGWEFMDEAHEIVQPKFLTQRMSAAASTLTQGKTNFQGTLNPPGIASAAPRTWLLFVTATLDVVQPGKLKPSNRDLSGTLEMISLPMVDAHQLARKATTDAEIYAALEAALEKHTATLEEYSILPLRSGQRGRNEESENLTYPTDFDPPQIPQSYDPGMGLAPSDWPHSGTTPTTFQARATGLTWETEPNITETGLISLVTAPERTRFKAWQDFPGNTGIKQPIFETQRINTALDTVLDRPSLVGTMSPPPSNALKGKEPLDTKNERVWFAFLTLRQ